MRKVVTAIPSAPLDTADPIKYLPTMFKKKHYLEGVVHEGKVDGRKTLTTWTTQKSEAERKAQEFRSQGADLARIFTDGRVGYRIVGWFQ